MTGCASAIRAAILRELEQRASHHDAADDICEITISVNLQAGTTQVRGVSYREERVFRKSERFRATVHP